MKINIFKWIAIVVGLGLIVGVVLLLTIKPTTYSIKFEADGTVIEEVYTNGNEILTLPTAPTKGGYTFKGWYFDQDVWENRLEEDTYENTKLESNITVYAYYEKDEVVETKYDIDFIVDGELFDTIQTSGEEVLTLPTAPTKGGYTFKGWYFDQDVWENRLEENTYENTKLESNITVYAYYEKDEVVETKYDIDFIVDGEVFDTIQTFGEEVLTLPTAPTKGGYTFKGWYFDQDVWENKLEENTYENTKLESNITVYAYYEKDEVVETKYDIDFIVDGEVFDTIQTSGEEVLTLPTAPTKGGYTFKGWYFDQDVWENRLEENTYENTKLESNITVYAYYEKDEVVSQVEFVIDNNGNISAVNNIDNLDTLVIPSTINGIKVTSLSNYLFQDNKTLTTVELPETLTDLGIGTFKNCSNLSSINLPSNLKVLYEYTFENCTSLDSITLPNTLTEIRSDCFRNTGLKSVSFPDSLKEVWEYGFAFCSNLENVNLNKVESLGGMVFQNCTNLRALNIPETLKEFDGSIFSGCEKLNEITLPDIPLNLTYDIFDNTEYFNNKDNWENNVLYIGKHLITVSREFNLTSYTVKDGTIDIADYSFYIGQDTLTNVVIPESVVSIGEGAFEYLTNLRTISLPNNLTEIGKYAFLGTGIESSSSSYWDGDYLYVGNYLIDVKDKSMASLSIKEGTLGIIDGALVSSSYASNVKTVTLPSSLKFIGKNNFEYMGIESIVLPQNLKVVGEKAFYYCRSLTTVDTSNCSELTKLGYSCFAGCNITTFTIPQTVEVVESYVFNFNKDITVNCQVQEKPELWDNLWSKVNGGGKITINWGVV